MIHLKWIGCLLLSVCLLALSIGCQKANPPVIRAPSGSDTTDPNSPTISSFSPGSDSIGGTVTIKGTNFSTVPANDTVRFNGVVAVVTQASATVLVVSVPVGASTGKITVKVARLTASSAGAFTIPPPTITSFSPSNDAVGVTVTITGSNYSGIPVNDTVEFNGVLAIVTAATPTQLTVLVPSAATTGQITVRVNGQTAVSQAVFTVDGVTTLAGSGQESYGDGPGPIATFSSPTGVAVDANGYVYVADQQNQRIRAIFPSGYVITFAGGFVGPGQIGSKDAIDSAARFNDPTSIALDKAGNLYVADVGNNEIRKITAGFGGFVTTFASIFDPSGIAVDGNGNVYVSSASNHTISKITSSGTVLPFAGTYGIPGAKDGTGSAASFNAPYGLAVDSIGNVYVADNLNEEIRKISPSGVVTTLAGNGSPGSADGTGAAASFTNPLGVVVDGTGNVYVTANNRIRKISPAGVVTPFAGSGVAGSVDGSLPTARFWSPYGIAIDATGNIYVADPVGNKIREITVQ